MKKMESVLMVILMVFVFGLAGCGTIPSLPSPPEMVGLESPLYLIGGENQVEGFLDFWLGLKSLYEYVSMVGGYPLVEGVEKHLESIKKCDSILVISSIPEGIQEYCDLENKYPDLCPLPCDELESELESHSSPLLYFSQDLEAEKLRGVIVASQVDPSLAELVSEGVPLDASFRYENGQLQILE